MSILKLYENDTVVLATEELKKGAVVEADGRSIQVLDDIPKAHKIAIKDFNEGDPVTKYNNTIGYATKPIKTGEWVHEHNMRTGLGKAKEYTYEYDNNAVILPGSSEQTWKGYLRKDGSAGIRNYLAVIPTVFCSNGPLQRLAQMAKEKYPASENFDGILPLTHPYGCSQTGKDLEYTCKILSGVIKNANFGGVLLVSLGCEITDPVELKKYMGDFDESRVKILSLQNCEDEFETGMELIDEIYEEMKSDRRQPLTFDKLHIAVNCGGSDGYSGITANTVIGSFCDRLVGMGATVNMTEVPEMMGAEHILMNRAVNEDVFHDVVRLIRDYEDYFARYGEKASDNPTQGNKAGGLTTLEEKSLGCIQKGGHCAVTEVIKYGDRVSRNGFVLVSGPGNDLAGVSGQIAAGAVLVMFTTGRGTPCGFAAPTFRLSSNTALSVKKKGWIDFDAGRLLEASTDKVQLADELFENIVATINGDYRTCCEVNGYFQLGILRDGVTL